MTAARAEPTVCELALSPHLSEAARGRALIAEVASQAGFPQERVFDITVACSEAIANAIEHAPVKGEVLLRTVLHPDRLEVEVQGPGEFQAPDRLKNRQSRGLGLPLMAKLSDHLALYSNPAGQTLVTLAFYRPGARPHGDEEALPPSLRELIESSGLVSAVIDAAPVGMYVLDPDLRFRWTNRAWRGFLDPAFHSADLTGLHYAEVVPGAEGMGLLDILRSISERGTTHTTEEFQFHGFERGVTYWRWEAFPLKDEHEGPPYSVVAVVSEVTETKKAKQALQESEEQFRVLTENLQSGVALINERAEITICNKAFLRLFDLRHDDDLLNINSRDWSEWQVFEESGGLLDVDEHPVRKAMRTRTAVRDVLVALQCPGQEERKWVLISAEPIFDAQGDLQRLICTYHDITQHKQAETALRASHERLQKVLEIETVGVMFWDLTTGCLVDANNTFLKMMGYSRADVEARDLSWQKFTPPEYHEVSLEEIRKFQATGRVGPYEKEYFRKDGTRQWMVFAGSSLGGDSCVEFCVDISDRKKAEAAVQQERDLLSALVASMQDEVWFADTQKQFRLLNPAVVDHFRLVPGEPVDVEAVAASLGVMRPDGSPRPVEEAPALRALKGEVITKEDESIRVPATGELRDRQVNAAPVKDKEGRIIGSVAVVRDVTERKRAEEALQESEQKYRALFDSLDEGFFLIDVIFDGNDRPVDLYYVEANAAATRMLGRDWTGKRLSEIGEGYEKYWLEIFGQVALTGKSVREQRYAAPEDKWWDFSVFKLGGPESRRIGNTFLDITERKRIEEALKATNEGLVRFNNATVGREMRIIELKGEVNELLAKAGLPRRYSVDDLECDDEAMRRLRPSEEEA